MNEIQIQIPYTITFRLQDSYISLNIKIIKKDNSSILYVQIEPLLN